MRAPAKSTWGQRLRHQSPFPWKGGQTELRATGSLLWDWSHGEVGGELGSSERVRVDSHGICIQASWERNLAGHLCGDHHRKCSMGLSTFLLPLWHGEISLQLALSRKSLLVGCQRPQSGYCSLLQTDLVRVILRLYPETMLPHTLRELLYSLESTSLPISLLSFFVPD